MNDKPETANQKRAWQSGTANREQGTANRRVGGIERMAREAATLVEKREVEYFGIEARSILNRCSSHRMPFTWTINPYRGCEFGCRYCYARYTHEYMGLNDPADFENKIYAKRDAARTLLRELTPERLAGQLIALGTATDPYQPAERRFRITRSLLEVLARADGVRLTITTKGDLITRDTDVLRQIAARGSLQVNITVTTVDARLARILEFRAPTPQKRLAALRALRAAGIRAGVNIAPILPDLTDSRESLAAVIAAAKDAGAIHVFANVLFLKESAQRRFFPFLEEHFPELAPRYARRYARSAYLDGGYKNGVLGMVEKLKQEYGIPDRQDLEASAVVHEAAAQQLFLGFPEPPRRQDRQGDSCPAFHTPDAPKTALDRGHKPLSPGPGPGYNPHGSQASGSVQPVLSGVPGPAVAGLFRAGPAG